MAYNYHAEFYWTYLIRPNVYNYAAEIYGPITGPYNKWASNTGP